MAGLRIRWRREDPPLTSTAAPIASSSALTLGVFLWAALVLIVGLGFAARAYNANWDNNGHLHPDERHITIVATGIKWPASIAEYFDTDISPLNPYNQPNTSFVYGTFPVFLNKAVAGIFFTDTYDDYNLSGRYLSAVFSAATIVVVFFLTRRLYGPAAALLGALLFAAAPLAIQHAHFFVTDPFLAFFTAATLYFAVRIAQKGSATDYAFAGLMLGLGTACKLTALALAPVVAVAALIDGWPALLALWRSRHRDNLDDVLTPASRLAIAVLVAFMAFRIAQPYAFETPTLNPLSLVNLNQRFLDDQRTQADLLGGQAAFPPSVQWIGRTSYVYPLQQMLTWGMGPAFGVAGWLGCLYAGHRLVRRRELVHLLPLLFVLLYFGFMGRQFSLYMRYFLPLYPVLAAFAGLLLVDAVKAARELSRRLDRPLLVPVARIGVAIVALLGIFAGLAYLNVYRHPVTRIVASAWAIDNIPPGKSIATEHWDDRVPGNAEDRYNLFDFALYEPDNAQKVQSLIDGLDKADYISISSNRLLQSIPRNRVNYPVTSHYYDLLFNGELGFRLLKSFTSYPSLFGIDFSDYNTEESFSSYDHPRVLIFEKTAAYSHDKIVQELGQVPLATGNIAPALADHNGLLLSPSDARTQQQGGTFSDIFSDSGVVKSYPTLLWFIVLQAAAFAVTPIALLLFRRLPDRGYLLAKPLGLVLLAYPVWLLVSLKLVHFERETIIGVLIALLAFGALVGHLRREEVISFFRANWKLVLFSEALFLLAFLFFRELRLDNPDLWHPYRGGEKPMDLAYLTAVTRSTTLPPYDPWFAGGYINYYYLGQFFTATLSKVTTIPPEVAFNLAVPTFFALTVAGAFSVAYNLAAISRSMLRRAPDLRAIPHWSPYVAGVVGAVLVALIGNLDGVGILAHNLSLVSKSHMETSVPLLGGVVNSIGGLWQVIFHGAQLPQFDFWRPSRMMPPTISITEFPYFSFLFADLHAHMMAIAFQCLTLGICLSLAISAAVSRPGLRDWSSIALLGLVVGSLRWINSWDYPPFLLLGLAVLLIGEREMIGGWVMSLVRLAAKAALLAGSSFVFYLPFLANYQAPVSGLHRSLETTPVHQYLAHFGILLLPVAILIGFIFWRSLRHSALSRLATQEGVESPLAGLSTRNQVALLMASIAVLLLAIGCLVLAAGRFDLVALLLPSLLIVVYLFAIEFRRRRRDSALRLFLLTLVGLGLGLSIGVDIVTINGDIERMNTVFKFYLHIWLLFALVGAYAIWYLLFVLKAPAPAAVRSRLVAAISLPLARGAIALLIVGGMLYPLLATPVRLDDRFADLPPTLDGMAYMQGAVYDDEKGSIGLSFDLDGIRWMRENVEGSPPIVEGRTPLYRWGGRFSIYTGLPAVLGWDWHQTQQRGELAFMVDDRARAVDQFYGNPDTNQAMQFLNQYGVQYVILGQAERYYYPAAGLAKLTAGLNGALEVVYANSQLTIYRVKPERLAFQLKAAVLDP